MNELKIFKINSLKINKYSNKNTINNVFAKL